MIRHTVIPLLAGLFVFSAAAADMPKQKLSLQAEDADFNPERVEIVGRKSFGGGKGVMLKPGLAADFAHPDSPPDVAFSFVIAEPGRYWVETVCDTTGETRARMPQVRHSSESPMAVIAVGDDAPARRVVMLPWRNQDYFRAQIQRYDFAAGRHQVRIWLPPEIGLDQLRITPYVPPEVPEAARNYTPPETPPAGHPRVWVTPETLPRVRANLTRGENREIWEKIQAEATAARPAEELRGYSAARQDLAVKKAFVFLMTGDRKIGREAVELAVPYFEQLNFGNNLLGETRQMGLAVYSAALVYDWCFELIRPEERQILLDAMRRIPEDMEIGWPPFLQNVVNGHGGEDQLNRELLAMAIAVYDEDPTPYRYCAFQIFERLIPMRAFEYQSGRHNQGVSYGSYRLSCEMQAAWLLRRMANRELFDPNIKKVFYCWLYRRLPGGGYLTDGDSNPGQVWHLARNTYMSYTYAADPVIKGDFIRQQNHSADPVSNRNRTLVTEPVTFLLINDPDLPAETNLDTLPLTRDFGPVLPGLIARTGWNLAADSNDVVAEMKVGGYYFGNHQHPDAGSFQIFHRGMLAGDLGRYKFYGRPYDYSYNKRTIAHSAMLVHDPAETFIRNGANDGGQRCLSAFPGDLNALRNDPQFKVGERLSSDFGPDGIRPAYSWLQGDITAAYTAKVEQHIRGFCFLNLESDSTPAALIVTDRLTAAKPEFRKYWVLNSEVTPRQTPDGLLFRRDGEDGGKMYLRLLSPEDCRRETATDDAIYRFFDQEVEPPHRDVTPAPGAGRTWFTPVREQKSDLFVAVMLIGDAVPVEYRERDGLIHLRLLDRIMILNPEKEPVQSEIRFEVPADGREYQVLLTNLAAGEWRLRNTSGSTGFEVEGGRGTLFARLSGGDYQLRPAGGR